MRSLTLAGVRAAGVALVTAEATGFGFTYADQAALLPLLASELGLGDVVAGLLSAALFLAYIVATLLTSGLPDRLGPKPVIAAGLALSTLGTAVFAVSPGVPALLAAKALQGVGSALAFVASARYVAGLYGSRRAHFALGIYGAGFPLGSALALLTTPVVASTLGGWRASYLAETLALAALLAAWLFAPDVERVVRPGSMRDALRCGNCWLVSLQHAAGFGLAITAGSWIALYLLREFTLPLALSGLLGSLLLFFAVLGRPLGGLAITNRLARTVGVMRAGNAAVIGGVALLALPGRPLPVALVGAVIVGIGVGIPYAPVFNTAGASLPRAPGAAQGLAAVGGTAGVTVGAPAMGFAVERWGFAAAWLFVAALAACALAGTFAMRGEEELTASREAADPGRRAGRRRPDTGTAR